MQFLEEVKMHPAKFFLILLIFSILFFSNSCDSLEKKAKRIADNLCQEIKNYEKENVLDSLEKKYSEEIKKYSANKDSTLFISLLKTELENCIRDLKFEKEIILQKFQLICSITNFLKLQQNQPIKIIAEGRENTAFVIRIPLQIQNSAELEAKSKIGKLLCFDKEKSLINEYPVYATLDIIRSFKKTDEKFILNVQLEPFWDALAENPFQLLKQSLARTKMIDSVVLFIDLVNNQQYFKELINKTDDFVK